MSVAKSRGTVAQGRNSNGVNTSMGGIARGSTANLAGAAIMAAANLVLTVTITRGMPRSVAGVFFSVTSLFLLATSIGQLGTGTGLVYFISRCRAFGTPASVGAYVRAATRPVLITAVSMAIVTFFFAPQIAALTNPQDIDQATHHLRVLAFFIPLAGLENVGLAATRGLGTMRVNVLVEQVGRPVLQLGLVLAAVLASSTSLLAWSWSLAYAPAALVAWVWWRRIRPRGSEESRRAGDSHPAAEFWKFSAPRAVTSVVQVVMQRFDIVLVGALAGAVAAAVYAATTRFVVVGQLGIAAISQATQPRLAEALAQDDQNATKEMYQTSTAWLMAITWPLYLSFVLFAAKLVPILGEGYEEGVAVLTLLSFAMLISAGCGMVDMVLAMAGHTLWNLGNAVLSLIAMLALDIWLIPSHGVLGAAVGWSSAIVIRNLAALSQVAFALRLHPFGWSSLASGSLGIICFIAVPGAFLRLAGGSTTSSLAGFLLGVTCYGVGVWRLRGTLQLSALRNIRRRRPPSR